jgi:hypothetical protein
VSNARDLKRACDWITAATQARDDIVVDLWKDGASYREIAGASDGRLSHGTVANIINRRTEGTSK